MWQDIERIVNIFEIEWMLIIIKLDVIKIETFKMYSLDLEDREFVNKKFDKLHEQERM